MPSVSTDSLKKSFGEVNALKELSFEVNKGELFGFIGPDGAGKTTLFRILTTLLLPDGGQGMVEGNDLVKDFRKIRQIVGYMPGRFSLYHDLTVEENLRFYATVFGTTVQENYHLIRDIYQQIEPFRKRKAGKLSGGMKQKLALSCALIHKPEVLFLDEPTTGVDAVSRKEFWEMLKRLKEIGITIIVSTPYMDEASLCDRIALIQDGEVMTIQKPDKVVEDFSKEVYSISSPDIYQLLTDLRTFEGTHSVYTFGQSVHLTLKREAHGSEAIMQYLKIKGYQQFQILKILPGIEDCFMELMVIKNSRES